MCIIRGFNLCHRTHLLPNSIRDGANFNFADMYKHTSKLNNPIDGYTKCFTKGRVAIEN